MSLAWALRRHVLRAHALLGLETVVCLRETGMSCSSDASWSLLSVVWLPEVGCGEWDPHKLLLQLGLRSFKKNCWL